MFDMKKMMQQAQQMQFKMQELQEKLKDIDVAGQAGGGLVKLVVSCAGEVKAIDIDPSLLASGDKETLEDLILAALNNAGEAKEIRTREETEKMMEQLGLPKGAKLPF
jgi:DNA-binding YbaB/EbfC family protein